MAAEKQTIILAVDDDLRLHERAREYLESRGFCYRGLEGGEKVVESLAAFKPDIVLLDVMMPGEDGFSVLLKIRECSTVPVIMLTARGTETDRIIGLELGADDYLAKPFNPKELEARIKAVLRRSGGAGGAAAPAVEAAPDDAAADAFAQRHIRAGGYALDAKEQTLSFGGNTATLSTSEFFLLRAFMTRPDKVLSREQLMQIAFGSDEHATSRSIDVHISRLRALLRDLGEQGTRIRTVWGAGYCWLED